MELIKVLDETGQETGQISERDLIHQNGLWHKEVAFWIFNSKGDVLIHRRSTNKKINPCKLGICAGHVPSNEDSITAAQRELMEEIGLKTTKKDIHFLITEKKEKFYNNNLIINRIFNDVYYLIIDKKVSEFSIEKEELSELFWINYLELKQRVINNDTELVFRYSGDEAKTFELLDQIYCKITH